MADIRILDNKDLCKEEVVSLLIERKRLEQGVEASQRFGALAPEKLNRMLSSFITKSLVAYAESGDLLGWLAVNIPFPTTMILCEYHPIVRPGRGSQLVARELLKRCFQFAREKEIRNIRTFIEVTEADKKRFRQLRSCLELSGMALAHVVLCMESKLTADSVECTRMPSNYALEPLRAQPIEFLNQCHKSIFSESNDRFTASLEDDERVHWGFFEEKSLNDASVVITHQNELVGLIAATDRGEFVELGPVGVVPEHRGRHLGSALMDACLSSLVSQGKLDCYLEVDTENPTAIHLYLGYGFHEVSRKYGFLTRLRPR